jgi:hypothetical protein
MAALPYFPPAARPRRYPIVNAKRTPQNRCRQRAAALISSIVTPTIRRSSLEGKRDQEDDRGAGRLPLMAHHDISLRCGIWSLSGE